MHDFLNLPAADLIDRMARRDVSVEAVVRGFIDRIVAREPAIQAWQFFDPELALLQARQCDAGAATGAFHGLPVGVKDLMDTYDMPTTYGSPIYAGYQPRTDAAVVAACRVAGAVIMGKTVTTEFATYQPGPTHNPCGPADVPHSPGGSSSGSAAAVAAGMVPVAFGTQTAGSIVRPAAYCGIVGYKPTHGTLPLAGIKPLSPSLDTVGVLARSVEDAAFFIGVVAQMPLQVALPGRLRVGICRTPHWDRSSADTRRAMDTAAQRLEQGGAVISDVMMPGACEGLTEDQLDIMHHEAYAAFSPELRSQSIHLSNAFKTLLAAGKRVDGVQFAQAQKRAMQARHAFATVFDQVDIVLAPSTEGEAPMGIGATGDPIFNRMWTLLGNPCVHVPVGSGSHGMPVGVTLIGPRFGDAQTLAAARELERQLS